MLLFKMVFCYKISNYFATRVVFNRIEGYRYLQIALCGAAACLLKVGSISNGVGREYVANTK